MAIYSINQFSNITGISKLLLRQWENRYGFLAAERTTTNIRFYTDELLLMALNTSFLLKNGYRISNIAILSFEEIISKVEKLIESENVESIEIKLINDIIQSAIEIDKSIFYRSYKYGVSKLGLIEFYSTVVIPAMNKIGLLWMNNKIVPPQEHFLSELIKQKLYSEIERIEYRRKRKKDLWLLFLPEKEFHSIGLLVSKFLLLKKSYEVIYLGENLPKETIEDVSIQKNIDKVLTFCISNECVSNLENMISVLNTNFKDKESYIVCKGEFDSKLMNHSNIQIIKTIHEFLGIIE